MTVSEAVVRKDELLVRWTFDESNGTTASDATGNGVDARLSSNTLWGAGKSGGGLDLSSGGGYADAGPHPNLQARIGFSYALWFKPNGTPADWSQILAKREGRLLSLFCSSRTRRSNVELFTDFWLPTPITESIPLPLTIGIFSYPHTMEQNSKLTSTVFCRVLKTKLVRLPWTTACLIGAAPDGSNAFNGWIDDVRLYKTALTAENVDIAYNDGFGDFGPT